jgi:thioredoxin 1
LIFWGEYLDNNLYLLFPATTVEGNCTMTKPVLMDFFAEWCGPCKRQGPILEDLKKKMGDTFELKKIDVDQNMELAQKYGIQVVPTLIIEKDGKVIQSLEGVTSAEALENYLKPLL